MANTFYGLLVFVLTRFYCYCDGYYSDVRLIASRILDEICLLIGELAIRGTKLTLNARLGTENNLLIEQYCH